MHNPEELRTRPEPPPSSPSDNGPSTLSDRVRSLRLPEGMGGGGLKSKLPWVLCLLLLASTVTFGYQAFRQAKSDSSTPGKPAQPPRTGSDKVATSGDIVLESKGYIIPAHQIQVSPLVSGIIEELHIIEGLRVEKGAILAKLKPIEYQAAYDRAEAGLEEAKQRLEEAKTSRPEEISKAEKELQEMRTRHYYLQREIDRIEKSLSTLSPTDQDKVRSDWKATESMMEAKLESLKLLRQGAREEVKKALALRVKQAEADLTIADWLLQNCTIRAPVSGTILSKKAEKGNIVNPIAFNISASLCDMADLSDLEVELFIQERDIANVQVKQRCTVMPEAFRDNKEFLKLHPQGYEGEVSRLMPIADRAKGAIPVRVKLVVPKDEEGVYLKPEMSVIVSFKKMDR